MHLKIIIKNFPYGNTLQHQSPIRISHGRNRNYFHEFTHFNHETNKPQMVDISNKTESQRIAHARCHVILPNSLFQKFINDISVVNDFRTPKGPVISTAIIAGVLASKRTSELIPFCHQVPLESCDISVTLDKEHQNSRLVIDCFVKTTHKTGVEMEALVGCNAAGLCIYDMCKAISHDIRITDLMLMSKSGGESDFDRKSMDQKSN